MGLGHVSPCPLCEARQGHDVPRREHRRARAHGLDLTFDRRQLARLGECIAARYLEGRGATVVGRNVTIARGEADLLVVIGTRRLIVEVKTVSGDGQPIDQLSPGKVEQLRRMARSLGEPKPRIDFMGVRVTQSGAEVQWLPQVG